MKIALRSALMLAVLVPALAAAAPAQELSISISAGGFFASEAAYRQLYGSGLSFAGDVSFKLKGPLGIAAGIAWLSDHGIAVPTDGGDEEYPVRFRRTTIPLVLFYEVEVKPVNIRFGAGIGIHRYREAWQTVDLAYEGHKISPRFVLSASFSLLDRLSLVGAVTYDTIATGAGSPLAETVNLGGVQVLGGLAFRIH